MTVAEQLALTAAATSMLLAQTRSWVQITASEQAAYLVAMTPAAGTGFTSDQRASMYAWWLPVTSAQLDALNAAAPAKTVLAARADTSGKLYLRMDILSDALNGRRLSALQGTLTSLTLVNTSSITWPAPVVTAP